MPTTEPVTEFEKTEQEDKNVIENSSEEEEKQPNSGDSGFVVLDGWSWTAKNSTKKNESSSFPNSITIGNTKLYNLISTPTYFSTLDSPNHSNFQLFHPNLEKIEKIKISNLAHVESGHVSANDRIHIGNRGVLNLNLAGNEELKKEKRKASEILSKMNEFTNPPPKMSVSQSFKTNVNTNAAVHASRLSNPSECEMSFDSETPHHPPPHFHLPKTSKFGFVVDEGSSSGKFKPDGGLITRALGKSKPKNARHSFKDKGKMSSQKHPLAIFKENRNENAFLDQNEGEKGLREINLECESNEIVTHANQSVHIKEKDSENKNKNEMTVKFFGKSLLTLLPSQDFLNVKKSKERNQFGENINEYITENSSSHINLNDEAMIQNDFPTNRTQIHSNTNTHFNSNLTSYSNPFPFSSHSSFPLTATSDVSESQYTTDMSQLQLRSIDHSSQCMSQQSIEGSEYSMHAISDPGPAFNAIKMNGQDLLNQTQSMGNVGMRLNQKTCAVTGCDNTVKVYSGLCSQHGEGMTCQYEGCIKEAEGKIDFCRLHAVGNPCQEEMCEKMAEGKSMRCLSHGGGGRRCQVENCDRSARGASGKCIRHGGGKRCQVEGCTRSAEGLTGKCIKHGGGRRCKFPECDKAAQGGTNYCKGHGGGRRCSFPDCNKAAEGKGIVPLCKGHGGGRRCKFDNGGCGKSVHGGTDFCIAHGGGKRCKASACEKSARGKTEFCVRHGGGKRCAVINCGKSAQGRTDFCKKHGGGKRCSWKDESSNATCTKFARCKSGMCTSHANLSTKELQSSQSASKNQLNFQNSVQNNERNEDKNEKKLKTGDNSATNSNQNFANFQSTHNSNIENIASGHNVWVENYAHGDNNIRKGILFQNFIPLEGSVKKRNDSIAWNGNMNDKMNDNMNDMHSKDGITSGRYVNNSERCLNNNAAFWSLHQEKQLIRHYLTDGTSNLESIPSKENWLSLCNDQLSEEKRMGMHDSENSLYDNMDDDDGDHVEKRKEKREGKDVDINLNLSIGHVHSSDHMLNAFHAKDNAYEENANELNKERNWEKEREKEKEKVERRSGFVHDHEKEVTMNVDMGFLHNQSLYADGGKRMDLEEEDEEEEEEDECEEEEEENEKMQGNFHPDNISNHDTEFMNSSFKLIPYSSPFFSPGLSHPHSYSHSPVNEVTDKRFIPLLAPTASASSLLFPSSSSSFSPSSSLMSPSLSSPLPRSNTNPQSNASAFRAYSGKKSSLHSFNDQLPRVRSELAISDTNDHSRLNLSTSPFLHFPTPLFPFSKTQNDSCFSPFIPLINEYEIKNSTPSFHPLSFSNENQHQHQYQQSISQSQSQGQGQSQSQTFEMETNRDQCSAFKPVVNLSSKSKAKSKSKSKSMSKSSQSLVLDKSMRKSNMNEQWLDLQVKSNQSSAELMPMGHESVGLGQNQSQSQSQVWNSFGQVPNYSNTEGRVHGGFFMPTFRDFLKKQ